MTIENLEARRRLHAEMERLKRAGQDGVKAEAEAQQALDELIDLSHDGLALAMGEEWTDARHVALWGRWLFWTGSRWEIDERLLHLTRARHFLRGKAVDLVRWAKRKVEAGEADERLVQTVKNIAKTLRDAGMVTSVAGLARSNPDQVAVVAQWDGNPWLLGTPGGTVAPASCARHGSTSTSPSRRRSPRHRPAPRHRSGRRSSSASSATISSWCRTCSAPPATRSLG
jgi:putative DNA primase/helicase